MPLSDVTVTIDLVKPAGLVGLGKPLILAEKAGTSTYKSYSDISDVKADFPDTTNAYKKAAAVFAQNDRPSELAIATYDPAATDGINSAQEAAEEYYDNDWFFLLTSDAEQAEKLAVADFVEGQKFKMYAVKTTTEDERKAFLAKAYDYVIDFYHPIAGEEAEAALIGECGSQAVGSITWKFKSLTGITPLNITKSELNAIHQDGAIAYVTKSGLNQTSEGTVVSGEYIDVMHGKSWIKTNMENSIQQAFANNKKIKFDHNGIDLLEGQVVTTLLQAYTNGIIAEDDEGNPIYSVTAKTRAESSAEERSSRVYNGLSFSFELAGAIHEANITGEIKA